MLPVIFLNAAYLFVPLATCVFCCACDFPMAELAAEFFTPFTGVLVRWGGLRPLPDFCHEISGYATMFSATAHGFFAPGSLLGGFYHVFARVLLRCTAWWWSCLAWYAAAKATAIGAVIFLCLKCLFVFLAIVLVRVTTPKFKLESITKLGWLYALIIVFIVFLVY